MYTSDDDYIGQAAPHVGDGRRYQLHVLLEAPAGATQGSATAGAANRGLGSLRWSDDGGGGWGGLA
jgi:hypothetical protein